MFHSAHETGEDIIQLGILYRIFQQNSIVNTIFKNIFLCARFSVVKAMPVHRHGRFRFFTVEGLAYLDKV